MSYLLDIFNKRQPAPQPDPTARTTLADIDPSGQNLWQRPMAMPSGGPNTGAPLPPSFDIQSATLPPMDMATAIACTFGAPPPQINRGPGGNAQNNPMPPMGGGMAPSMPNAVDQGLGMQQMNFGNPMGGMNNWFSNFAAPRPMPAPAPAAPAPMMPMKGMFGVR